VRDLSPRDNKNGTIVLQWFTFSSSCRSGGNKRVFLCSFLHPRSTKGWENENQRRILVSVFALNSEMRMIDEVYFCKVLTCWRVVASVLCTHNSHFCWLACRGEEIHLGRTGTTAGGVEMKFTSNQKVLEHAPQKCSALKVVGCAQSRLMFCHVNRRPAWRTTDRSSQFRRTMSMWFSQPHRGGALCHWLA
jgi:hypothetical protein